MLTLKILIINNYCLDFGFPIYLCPCSAHARYIGTGRGLLTGHNALLLRQIARDLYMHYHIDTITHGTAFGEPSGGTGGSKLVIRR